MEKVDEASRQALTLRFERSYLVHVALCVPFALAWAVAPEWLGRPEDAERPVVAALRWLYGLAVLSLVFRAWSTRKASRAHAWVPFFWPIFDGAIITAALAIARPGPDNWAILLYVLPVIQAAFTQRLPFALAVGVGSALAWLVVQGPGALSELRYAYFGFQACFLAILASLLTRLTQALAQAEAELARSHERRDLAQTLHDRVQQSLVTLALRLDAVPAPDEADVARQINDDLRLLVRRTAPSGQPFSTADALRLLTQWFEQRTGFDVRISLDPLPMLDPAADALLLRTVQEGLTNAAKYGGAMRIDVVVTRTDDGFRVSVCNDGPPVTHLPEAGFGLSTLRSEAETQGGQVSLLPRSLGGAELRLELPWPAGAQP